MKSEHFRIDKSRVHQDPGDKSYVIEIPTLPAYAVEYAHVWVNGLCGDAYSIEGRKLRIPFPDYSIDANDTVGVTVFFHGFRDFDALFPQVTLSHLQQRLGRFYAEAEKCLDEAAWLSFALMCGAIFEGLLFWRLGKTPNDQVKFYELVEEAHQSGLIDPEAKRIMHSARDFRNRVHADNYDKDYVERKDAMDIRTTMGKMIQDFSL